MKIPEFVAAVAIAIASSTSAASSDLHAPPARSHTGFAACPQFFPAGKPIVPTAKASRVRELCFDAFAVLHSGSTKTPVYVVQRLTRDMLVDAKDEKRTNRFFADARLPSAERATLEDYQGSGLDRGHLAAAAEMPTAQAMAQSFSLANVVPQAPNNNRGAWAKSVERATRKYVLRTGGPVYAFSGPVYQGTPQTIGPGRVRVPTHLFKLVYDPRANRAWAHWVQNTDDARAGRPISYEELVRRTGIEFLPGVTPRN